MHRRQQPAVREVEVGRGARREVRVERPVRAHVPHLELAVDARRRHVAAAAVDAERRQRALVAEHLDERLVHVRAPQRHRAVAVAKVHHAIPRVGAHHAAVAEPRRNVGDGDAGAHVEVAQVTTQPHRREQPVVPQELQPLHRLRRAVIVVGPQAVEPVPVPS